MATFSERYGYKPVRAALGQYESMDDGLRIAIWNFLQNSKFIHELTPGILHGPMRIAAMSYPIDREYENIRIHNWYSALPWNEIYDLVEFCIRKMVELSQIDIYDYDMIEHMIGEFNKVLRKEGSAYRVVNESIVPVSNSEEFAEVEQAANANDYIQKAVELLANRENPDIENVIKESISAVEYEVREATGEDISRGLEKLALHSQLAQAWKNMYQWASDEPGVRHAKPERSDVGIAEARYVLVAASAFVNYLKLKKQQQPISTQGTHEGCPYTGPRSLPCRFTLAHRLCAEILRRHLPSRER